jgi:hypothetical protein
MDDLVLTIELAIDIRGASTVEIERGIAAAWRVFQDAGVTAWEAASAAFKQESIDDSGEYFREFTAREGMAAEAWRATDRRAAEACCTGWPNVPDTAHLELIYDRDAYNAWASAKADRRDADGALLRAVSRRE